MLHDFDCSTKQYPEHDSPCNCSLAEETLRLAAFLDERELALREEIHDLKQRIDIGVCSWDDPRVEALREEVGRLRRQNHEAAEERDKRYAADTKELVRCRDLFSKAREMHEADMARQGKPVWTEISGYGQGAAALLIERVERAEAALAEVTKERNASREDRDRWIARWGEENAALASAERSLRDREDKLYAAEDAQVAARMAEGRWHKIADERSAGLANAHCLLQECHAAIDPEVWGGLSERLFAAINACELPQCQHVFELEKRVERLEAALLVQREHHPLAIARSSGGVDVAICSTCSRLMGEARPHPCHYVKEIDEALAPAQEEK